MKSDAKSTIEAGKAILGIEFGSTRIKAVLIDQENKPIAQESHRWENVFILKDLAGRDRVERARKPAA